jgi:hypothetical protein
VGSRARLEGMPPPGIEPGSWNSESVMLLLADLVGPVRGGHTWGPGQSLGPRRHFLRAANFGRSGTCAEQRQNLPQPIS